jgi:hypothetical protein
MSSKFVTTFASWLPRWQHCGIASKIGRKTVMVRFHPDHYDATITPSSIEEVDT